MLIQVYFIIHLLNKIDCTIKNDYLHVCINRKDKVKLERGDTVVFLFLYKKKTRLYY